MSETIWKQANRWLHVTSSLGEDAILAEELEGCEEISAPFLFKISALTRDAIAPASILGTDMTLSVSRFGTKTRYISGIVTELSTFETTRDGYRHIRMTIEPSIAVLRHSSNYKIFQEKTVVEIVTAVLRERSIANVRFDVVGAQSKRAYCVQFGEADLAFVTRLLAEEGYFYFFEHTASAHTLVVTDSETKYLETAPSSFQYTQSEDDGLGIATVRDLHLQTHVIDMKSVSRQFDFEAPATPIDGTMTTSLSFTTKSGWEHFRYGRGPALAASQTTLAGASVDVSDRKHEVLSGRSSGPELTPGHKFTLATDFHADVKLVDGKEESLDGEAFVIFRVSHSARDPSYFARRPSVERRPFYRADFAAIPGGRAFRLPYPTPKPLAFGPQTAIVVGPSGSEIYTDKHGRVRVQFHWDRLGTKDENSSCFIRVAQSWAGNAWGTQFVPRIGMEVVVHFLDGDPDQPLVTGVLYNGANVPPFALPAQMNKSGVRTRSTKTGSTETFSELSFDDTKGSEKVLFHAEKDLSRKVENDELLTVGRDQTRTIKNNRTTTISDGNESFTIAKGHRTEEISQGNETLTIKQGDRTAELTQGNDVLKLGGGNLTITLTSGNMSTELKAGNLSQKCSAGSVTIEAMQGITLKCGQSTIEIKPQGITIQGGLVTVKATGKAEVAGAMVDVKASGIAQLGGALVKIN